MTFNPNEARDEKGRWTDGGAGADTSSDKAVLNVGGDKWNRETAARLEQEYAKVRPIMHQLAQEATGKEGHVPTKDEDEEPMVMTPDEWGALSGAQQADAEHAFQDKNFSHMLESEHNIWIENGDALAESKHMVAQDDDWKAETMTEFLDNRSGPRIPYTADQLIHALKIDYSNDSSNGSDGPHITFDESKLQEPVGAPPKGQMNLPGIEPKNPSDALTKEMRDEIVAYFDKAFDGQAQEKVGDLEPPDYLEESAKEYLDSQWSDMSDDDKFEWTKANTDLIDEEEEESVHKTNDGGSTVIREPEHYDPLSVKAIGDYRRTQAISHYLSDHRTQQIMQDRGIIPAHIKVVQLQGDSRLSKDVGKWTWLSQTGATIPTELKTVYDTREEAQAHPPAVDLNTITSADKQMWSDWKGSSTSTSGQIMQAAAAEELGGRLRGVQRPDDATLKEQYDTWKSTHPGASLITLDEFKEYWATVYSPAALAKDNGPMDTRGERVVGSEDGKVYTRLPDISLVRNGLASTTINPTVANKWGGTGNNAPGGIDKTQAQKWANEKYSEVGGWEGVKAMVRAKWETTQYMLDRAGDSMLDLYRGINYQHTHDFSSPSVQFKGAGVVDQGSKTEPMVQHPTTGAWIKPDEPHYGEYLDTLHSAEEAVKSAAEKYGDKGKGDVWLFEKGQKDKAYNELADSLKPDQVKMIVNKYGTIQDALNTVGHPPGKDATTRVVLRMQVPRTAVLSVPAYGINEAEEREVVIAGTAWKDWEAWSDKAPTYENVKPHAPAETENVQLKKLLKTQKEHTTK